MIKKILSLFLILIAVGAGLCSAQTAGKKYYLVDGLFFEGMPPCVSSDNVATFITPVSYTHLVVVIAAVSVVLPWST